MDGVGSLPPFLAKILCVKGEIVLDALGLATLGLDTLGMVGDDGQMSVLYWGGWIRFIIQTSLI